MAIIRAEANDKLHAIVFYDRGGLPRCVSNPANAGDGVVFVWDSNNSLGRDVYAVSLQDRRFFRVRHATGNKGCLAWRKLVEAVKADNLGLASYTVLPPEAHSVQLTEGLYTLAPAVLAGLADARRGSNVALGSASAQEYVARGSPVSYSRTYNRRATHFVGAGYSAEIYKAWLNSLPRNANLRSRIEKAIAEAETGRLAITTGQRLRGLLFLVAEGYMQTPKKDRLKPLLDVFDAMGVRYQKMAFDPLGGLQANASGFQRQIAAALSDKKNRVILLGASKGVPEMLKALADAVSVEPALTAQIATVISIAGMFEGSFLLDWAQQFPQNLFVGLALHSALKDAGLPPSLPRDGLFSMSTASLAAFAAAYAPRLPRVPYFNLVGTLSGDGRARDPEIAKLQTDLIAPELPGAGGNDGYIEYPGTMMPRAWNLDSTEIVFDASHVILDGSYDGRDLTDLKSREAVFSGIFQAIADEIQPM